MKNKYERDNEDLNNEEEEQNKKEYLNQENEENVQNEEDMNGEDDDDDRLTYTLITLDLGNLIHIFEDNNISFVDMLMLSKEDMIELQLEIFQRNRILNFSKLFAKYAKNYSIREISDFFSFNKQFIFNSTIYDKVYQNNLEQYQNKDNLENTFHYDLVNQDPNFIMNKSNKNISVGKNDINEMFPKEKVMNEDSNYVYKNFTGKNSNKSKGKVLNKFFNITTKINSNQNKSSFKNDIISKITNAELEKNELYKKLINKIEYLECYENNYNFNEKFSLIKHYINNKGDKITLEDIANINNDLDKLVEENINKNQNIISKNGVKLFQKNKF